MNVPVLMYHSICRDGDEDGSGFTVSATTFRRQLEYLFAHGYQSVTVKDVLAGRTGLDARSVVLTFDDGYLDNYEVAFPLLQELECKACVFAVGNFSFRKNWWDATPPKDARLLDGSHMREMARHGIEFGAHGMTHRSLVALDAATMRRELLDARAVLEDAVGMRVGSIAYPYGEVDADVKTSVREAGFSSAFAVNSGPLSFFEDRFEIRRVLMGNRSDVPYMMWKLSGLEKRLRHTASGLRASARVNEAELRRTFASVGARLS